MMEGSPAAEAARGAAGAPHDAPGGRRRAPRRPAPRDRALAPRPLRGPGRHPPRPPPGRPRPDDRGNGPAPDRHGPPWQRPLHVGGHDLPPDLHDQRPLLRQALRLLRAQAAPPLRDHRLPGRLGALRPEPVDGADDPLPGDPGNRRRVALPDLAGGHRRPLHARRARQVPGALRRRLRALGARRPGPGRLHHRQHQLALDLLHQPPDRAHLPGRGGPGPALDPAAPRRAQPRLAGQSRLRGRHDPAPRGPHQQAVRGVDRPPGGWAGGPRARPPGRLPVHREPGEGADRPARPLAGPDLRGLARRHLLRLVRVLRGGDLPAPLLPGRPRRKRHGQRVRPDAPPDRRHHARAS